MLCNKSMARKGSHSLPLPVTEADADDEDEQEEGGCRGAQDDGQKFVVSHVGTRLWSRCKRNHVTLEWFPLVDTILKDTGFASVGISSCYCVKIEDETLPLPPLQLPEEKKKDCLLTRWFLYFKGLVG